MTKREMAGGLVALVGFAFQVGVGCSAAPDRPGTDATGQSTQALASMGAAPAGSCNCGQDCGDSSYLVSPTASCGSSLVVCYGGHSVAAEVRGSGASAGWGASPALLHELHAGSGTFVAHIYGPNDPAIHKDKACGLAECHPQDGGADAGGGGGVANACGVGSCNGDPACESCLQDGACAEGPDPIWNGTACVCPNGGADCNYPYCCAAGAHWDPAVCALGLDTCMPDGFANACGIGSCNGDPNCESCLQDGQCAGGPDPVWNGTECVCAEVAAGHCFYPYCCSSGTHWDATACACVQ